MMDAATARRVLFAACKRLGLDDDARRAVIQKITGKTSSTQLTPAEWGRVVAHLNQYTRPAQSSNEWAWVDTAAPERQPLLRKLIMLAKSAGIARGRQIGYIEGIAKQAGGLNPDAAVKVIKPLRLCDAAELRVLVQALSVHIRRVTQRAAKAGSAGVMSRRDGILQGSPACPSDQINEAGETPALP